MVACHCQGIRSAQIEKAFNDGLGTYLDVLARTKACRGCGSCAPVIVKLVAKLQAQESKKDTNDYD